jgi:transposase InsO family protein
VGWHADSSMSKELVITALDRAYQREHPQKGLLHHSDRGSQYASYDYQQRLKKYQMKPSMSRKGDCYDNAMIESFHGILKRELVHPSSFSSRQEALRAVFEYIECFYNRRRIVSMSNNLLLVYHPLLSIFGVYFLDIVSTS